MVELPNLFFGGGERESFSQGERKRERRGERGRARDAKELPNVFFSSFSIGNSFNKNTVIFFKYIDSRMRKNRIERQTTITTTTTTWRKNIILVVNTPYHR